MAPSRNADWRPVRSHRPRQGRGRGPCGPEQDESSWLVPFAKCLEGKSPPHRNAALAARSRHTDRSHDRSRDRDGAGRRRPWQRAPLWGSDSRNVPCRHAPTNGFRLEPVIAWCAPHDALMGFALLATDPPRAATHRAFAGGHVGPSYQPCRLGQRPTPGHVFRAHSDPPRTVATVDTQSVLPSSAADQRQKTDGTKPPW